jgi:hypothetical protein
LGMFSARRRSGLMPQVVELQVDDAVACSPARDAAAYRHQVSVSDQAGDDSDTTRKERARRAASSESPHDNQRSSSPGSPAVRRGEFLLTQSEEDILFPAQSRHLLDRRAFAESSWAQNSSVSLRSVDGPETKFSGGGFNPNQLGKTLNGQTGQRPGRAGDPTRLSEGSKLSWPAVRPPIHYAGDRVRNVVFVGLGGRKQVQGSREVNRNLAGWQLSARSRPMSPRVYTNLRNPVKTPARSAQERLHSAPTVAHGSTALVFGAATARARSPFTPRQLSLGGWGKARGEAISTAKGVPGPRLGFQFSPPIRPRAM